MAIGGDWRRDDPGARARARDLEERISSGETRTPDRPRQRRSRADEGEQRTKGRESGGWDVVPADSRKGVSD
ncbi:uncharacterized protein TERG_12343 [Trichophyton rubrum CBS 118892]|uniref:Uncharacterized protein n=1 Tax=Trichophyton rubrum (strain ATCC MYA-4607 / CBS 118892) TaxID=559305 RepID=A0A080WMQ0_TRIRC|nr:uncharacterized protein TERG_12343 [Trichophyton rubrum CBS 118892]KFL62092.1 hypothetical protein TERG_12343 [Trichophyton rubrum CBS 118892]